MNRLAVLTSEREGMTAAIAEIDAKLAQAAAQRDSIAILLEAVEAAIAALPKEEQLELPFPEDNVIEFPTVLGKLPELGDN
jgi:hypothetical protein